MGAEGPRRPLDWYLEPPALGPQVLDKILQSSRGHRERFGIAPLDHLLATPHQRNLLVFGRPGSGRTALALAYFVHHSVHWCTPNLFVTDEAEDAIWARVEAYLPQAPTQADPHDLQSIARDTISIVRPEAPTVGAGLQAIRRHVRAHPTWVVVLDLPNDPPTSEGRVDRSLDRLVGQVSALSTAAREIERPILAIIKPLQGTQTKREIAPRLGTMMLVAEKMAGRATTLVLGEKPIVDARNATVTCWVYAPAPPARSQDRRVRVTLPLPRGVAQSRQPA